MITSRNVPGVYLYETDKSFYSRGTEDTDVAMITPTVTGAKLVPVVVYSYAEYVALFGSTVVVSNEPYEYFGSICAREYFAQGGKSLLVVPTGAGSFAPATATIMTSEATPTTGFILETLSDGAVMNSGSSTISGSFNTLTAGTAQNIRYEIVSVDADNGTFNMLIRRGDDNDKRKIILETWNNLSLDPYSDNYIAKRIGDSEVVYNSTGKFLDVSGSYVNRSAYVRVKQITAKTPNYVKTTHQSLLPTASGSGFTGGADGTVVTPINFFQSITSSNAQGISASSTAYDVAIELLSNKEEYTFNILVTPGITATSHPLIVAKALAMVESREDCLYIMDGTLYGASPSDVTAVATNYDTSFGAMYYGGWLKMATEAGKQVFCPPSTVIPGVFAYSDSVTEPWYAPAGLQRGSLSNVIDVERKLTSKDRELLGKYGVNSIAKWPKDGIVVYAQETLQKKATALDRISVRRLLTEAKRFVEREALKLIFEPNTPALWASFSGKLRPWFESVQQRKGLYAFSIKVDDTINTNETIDQYILRAEIAIQPAKNVEEVVIGFRLTNTGVQFD